MQLDESPQTPEEKRQRELAVLSVKLRRALTEAPALVGFVWAQRLRFGATQSGGAKVSGSKTPPAPIREGAFDDANRAYAVLVGWAVHWSRVFLEREPSVAAAWSRAAYTKTTRVREAIGFPGITTPEGATALTRPISAYLLRRQGDILRIVEGTVELERPRAEEYATEVIRGLARLRLRHGVAESRHGGQETRVCPICDAAAVEVAWYSSHTSDLIVQCHSCHAGTDELLRALGIGKARYSKFLSWLETGTHIDDAFKPVPFSAKDQAHLALARRLGRTDLYLPPYSKP